MNTQPKKQKLQGKKPSHRRSLMRAQLVELIRNKRVQTTPARAKLLKANFDRLVTKAKRPGTNVERSLYRSLPNKRAVERLVNVIVPTLQDRNSGYTNSARTLPRKGDNAEQTIVMIVGTEVKQKKTLLQKQLEKQSKPKKKVAKKESKSTPVESKQKAPKGGRKHESKQDNRRVSM